MKKWLLTFFDLCTKDELGTAWYIDTDAEFSLGSSGGGLFNARGELVGITTFITPPEKEQPTGGPRRTIHYVVPALHVQTLLEKNPDKALLEVAKYFADELRFQTALETLSRIDEASERASALLYVARARLLVHHTSAAVAVLEQAVVAAGMVENATTRAKRRKAIAKRFAEARQFKRALQVAASIGQVRLRARARSAVAKEQAEQGLFGPARDTVSLIARRKIREDANDYVIRKHLDVLKEKRHLARALEVAEEIRSEPKRVSELRGIARLYGKLNNVAASREAYAKAIQAAGEIGDTLKRVAALLRIASDLADEDYRTQPRPFGGSCDRTC